MIPKGQPVKSKKLTAAEKKKVKDAVIASVLHILENDQHTHDYAFESLDGIDNKLCYDESKCDALNDEVNKMFDKVMEKIKNF
jgi:hypothetical protein